MSAPLAVDDVISATYYGTLFEQQIETVMMMRVSQAPSTGASAEVQLVDWAGYLADPAHNLFLAAMMNAAGNNFYMDYLRLQKLYPTRTIYGESPVSLNGGQEGSCTQSNLAVSLEKQTITVGRKGVGRVQFAPIPAGVITSGKITAGYQLDYMVPICEAMIGEFDAGATHAGKFHYCLPAAAGGGSAYDIFNAFPWSEVRTMHRRTLYVGI